MKNNLFKQAVCAIVVVVLAYAFMGIGCMMYAEVHKAPTAQIVAESDEYDGFEEATLTDTQYAVIDSMFWAAMSVDELRADFERTFPKEYDQMMTEGDSHDCVECRLKGIASCYEDAVWADVFDDCNEDEVSYQFEKVLSDNVRINTLFNVILGGVNGSESYSALK